MGWGEPHMPRLPTRQRIRALEALHRAAKRWNDARTLAAQADLERAIQAVEATP